MIQLSSKWAKVLLSQPETGMGYQIVTIQLKNGSEYPHVVIIGGVITQIRRQKDIPFDEDSISGIIVTHDRWDFDRES